MKKTILSLILLMCCWTGAAWAASGNTLENPQTYQLLTTLELDVPAPGEAPVTRAQFTYILIQILSGGRDIAAGSNAVYQDVDADRPEFAAISYARSLGILSPAENFQPDDPILPAEALKMLTIAAGYAPEAEESGGYPSGYIATAAKKGFTQRLDLTVSTLTADSLYTLLSNALAADIRVPRTYGGDTYTYETKKGNTLLTEYFDLSPVEGVVTANAYTSLYSPEDTNPGHIEIEGIPYRCESYDELLGHNVFGYCRVVETVPELIFAVPRRNRALTVNAADLLYADQTSFRYTDESGKEKAAKLSAGAVVLYNGKALPKPEALDFIPGWGSVQLIDHSGDNAYDVICINSAQTLRISAVDLRRRQIYDMNNGPAVDMEDESTAVTVTLDGAPAELDELAAGMIVNAYVSKDQKRVHLDAVSKTVTGSLESFHEADRILRLDGMGYALSPYFMTHYFQQLSGRSQVTLCLDSFGNAAALEAPESSLRYGYLLNAAQESAFGTSYTLRVFTDTGELKELSLADKITVDNTPCKAQSFMENYVMENQQVREQLIRYSLNSTGEIKVVDTVYTQDGIGTEATGFLDENRPENDRLCTYPYQNAASGTVYFKTGLNSVGTHFFISGGAPIFFVVDDTGLPDAERCLLKSTANLTGDYPFQASRLTPYNVTKSGIASAVVYRVGSLERFGSLDANAAKGLVSSAASGISQDGSPTLELELYITDRVFKTYTIEDVTLLDALYADEDKDSGQCPISPGDYVRFIADSQNTIVNISKDFDASSQQLLYSRGGENEILRYYFGTAYDSEGSLQTMSSHLDASEIENDALPLYCLKVPSFAVVFDSAKNAVYPVSSVELVNYLQNSEAADRVLAVTRYLDCQALVIYR